VEKIGIVKYVALKTGGIQLEGEQNWYNAIEKAKAAVIPELRGKKVKLNLTSPKVFDSVSVWREEVGIDKPKATRNELLIARQVAIKAAAEVANTESDLIKLAEKLEGWILR
jgi:hypothetical protein